MNFEHPDCYINFIQDLYRLAKPEDGLIAFRASHEQKFYSVSELPNSIQFLSFLKGLQKEDAFYSFSTFRTNKHTENAITNIFGWSIDVDYHNDVAHPLDVYQYILDNVAIPLPNYIEYGHRLRLIYIFSEPLRLVRGCRKKLLNGFKFMQKCFADMINEELSFGGFSFGAESNPPCSFFRIPESINTKDGSIIQIEKISDEKYSLQELFEEFIPNKMIDKSGNAYVWKDAWKKKQKKKKQKNIIHPPQTSLYGVLLWKERMQLLRLLQQNPSLPRKRACHLYANGLIMIGIDNEDVFHTEMSAFNNRFYNPLSDGYLSRTYRWQLYCGKSYKYKNETIASLLELTSFSSTGVSRKERDAIRYKERRKGILSKKDKMDERLKEIVLLKGNGESISSISRALNISISTVKREWSRFLEMQNEKKQKQIDACKKFIKEKRNFSQEENSCFIKRAVPKELLAHTKKDDQIKRNSKAVCGPMKKKKYCSAGFLEMELYKSLESCPSKLGYIE